MYSLNASEMAESTKVRLVRCPKCENLLPELADYSVYQCGGCGAVLRAKNKNQEAECSSENLEEEKPRGISSKSGNTSGKGIVDSSDASDADPSSNSGTLRNDQSEHEKCDLDSAAICGNESEFTAEKRDVDCGQSSDFIKVELSDVAGSEHQDLSSQYEYPGDSRRSRQMSDWKNGDEKQMGRLWRIPGNAADCVRISTSNPLNDGPSNQHLDSSFHNVSSRKYNDLDGASELGRAVLLRKLDELKEQLIRSCDVADKTKEKGPFEGSSVPLESSRGYTESRFPDGFGVAEKSSTLFSTNNHAAGPSHYGHVTEKLPYPIEHDLARQGLYPIHNPHYAAGPGYADSFGSQVLNRSPHQFPSEYQQQPSHPYFPEACIGTNQDPFMSYSQSSILHQPSCSCFLCYEKHRHIPATVSSTSFSHNRFPDIPCNPMLHQFDNPGAFGSHFNNSRCSMPPLNLRGTKAHSRWPSNVNSEMARFVRLRPQRVVVASGAQHCRPLYGGAPFLTCQNCFELLKLPKKLHSTGEKRQKLRCGACSSVIKFSVINKKLVLQDCVEEVVSPDLVDDSSTDFVKESTMHHHGHMNRVAADFSSDDYDNSDYDFQSLDIETVPPLNCRALNSMKPQEMPGFHSPASTSEDENSPDVLIPSIGVVNSFQHPIKTSLSPPPPGSPLQDYFDYSSNNNAVNRIGKGNRSARSDQEKVVSHKGATRQNSLKEASLVSEMEVSFNEFSNNETSQHSSDAAKNDQPKTTKGSESFFSNIIKKSFKDFSRSNHGEEYGKSNVSVNGHCIPERVVKKAQKAAGPIQAGHYWYDYRAGFWGVMNGPCLGIIPPFIEEFNYPMPEKCASGNTGVFVNGRELHQKDLDLLAGRGLPTDGDRSYIIEMSGRVLDEDTGEELDCLGKLAPTVEKVKRGFGMKVPRPAA